MVDTPTPPKTKTTLNSTKQAPFNFAERFKFCEGILTDIPQEQRGDDKSIKIELEDIEPELKVIFETILEQALKRSDPTILINSLDNNII